MKGYFWGEAKKRARIAPLVDLLGVNVDVEDKT
jgi:hypothetical protein